MDGAASAGAARQPAGDHAAPRTAIVLGSTGGSGCGDRVEAPDRVLRMWSLLNNIEEELHQVTLPADAEARLARQLETVAAELERSVSPMLASELRRLAGHGGSVPLTLPELRVRHAGLLGWTGGLVIAMLDQFEIAPAHLAETEPGMADGSLRGHGASSVLRRGNWS